ncbi:MAG: twin-arginine translocation signal domain-containing protein, partial [Anaerolineae bacterium]
MNNNVNRKSNRRKTLTRREFLRVAGVTAGALLVGCGPKASPVAPETVAPAAAT